MRRGLLSGPTTGTPATRTPGQLPAAACPLPRRLGSVRPIFAGFDGRAVGGADQNGGLFHAGGVALISRPGLCGEGGGLCPKRAREGRLHPRPASPLQESARAPNRRGRNWCQRRSPHPCGGGSEVLASVFSGIVPIPLTAVSGSLQRASPAASHPQVGRRPGRRAPRKLHHKNPQRRLVVLGRSALRSTRRRHPKTPLPS